MIGLLLLFVINAERKSVEVRYTEIAPQIDGVIEDVWQAADSAYDFVQFMPYEKTAPTEKTAVYVLQDKENLYIAFRCYADSIKPVSCLTADEDDIRIGIDTFGSKNTAYYFLVFASGIRNDGWVLDDGRTFDDSWEGVWYRAVRLYDDRWEVEIKIPFKSIRYKKGLDEWGIAFGRYMAQNRETSLWNEYLQKEDVLVSKYGSLTRMNPQTTGYYFEFYPEAYLRVDRHYYTEDTVRTDSTKRKPGLGLNFKWDITPQTTLNATILPDFAQIESDPFSLNLSQYPTYLDERRPFFLEGAEIFRMADFGDMGFFDPLEIFYSRRIGKSVDDDAVPILGGIKLTSKTKDWDFGILGSYTDEYEYPYYDWVEPHRWFGVARARRAVLENSNIGLLFSGMMVERDDYNYAFGLDGAYRKGANQFVVQGALSTRKDSIRDKFGWAFDAGYFGFIKNFITFASARVIQDSFDVTHVGFVPWTGEKRLLLMTGPYREYRTGAIRNFFVAPGIIATQEPSDSNWSIVGLAEFNTQFRNNWGLDFSVGAGPYYEADTNYTHRSLDLSVWGNLWGNHINFGCNYSYEYNYMRGFPAYQGTNRFTYTYSIIPELSLGLSFFYWIEWNPDNEIIYTWPMFRPRVDIRFNADMSLSIFDEIVTQTPGTDFGELDLQWNRIGVLYAWNFMPKSWLYLALNDHRVQDAAGTLQPLYQGGAIKAKYLIYF